MARAKSKPVGPPLAFSYLRFSSPEQGQGDSVRRQTALRDAWLAKSGAVLDTSLSLTDAGRSAFTGAHRKNPDRNALAAFLELVKQGRIPRGSFLIVESLDRLTREDIRAALMLLLNLIESGVRVVQLLPVEQVFDEKADTMALMMAIMELTRGHSESKMKSERVGGAWREKKKRARSGEVLTRAVPSWLRVSEDGEKFEVIEERAATVRRIYSLAIEGHGIGVITKRLNREKVPPIGRGDMWARSSVTKLLNSRAVVGEFQPHTGHVGPNRKKDGDPIPNYFPAILKEQQWQAARGSLASRRGRAGRNGARVNLFTGLLRDARDGGSIVVTRKGAKASPASLVSYRATQGKEGAVYVSFPLEAFEGELLRHLSEIDPKTILPADDSGEVALSLQGRLSDVETRLGQLRAKLVASDDDVGTLVEAVRGLEAERRTLADELSREKQRAASPLAGAWGETRSLVDVLRTAEDLNATRTRLRAVLRRIVTDVRCLFVRQGSSRIALVQVWFEGGKHRDYIILHVAGHGNKDAKREARTWSRSFESPARSGEFDLRTPGAAAGLESVLSALDVRALVAGGATAAGGG